MDNLIKFFHGYYARTKDPRALEVASNLGKVKPDTFEEEWKKKVNAGCERNGIPHIY